MKTKNYQIYLSLATWIGFYVVVLLLVVGCLSIPYFEWKKYGNVESGVSAFSVIGALLLVRSFFPLKTDWDDLGLSIDLDQHPKIQSHIREIAAQAKQKMPTKVVLILEMNAFVIYEKYGGKKEQRILGIGLPLLLVLNTAELKAVLAHEYGHYQEKDTALGSLMFRIRNSVSKILSVGSVSFVSRPLFWYYRFYLMVTKNISQQFELEADALAAKIMGRDVTISGLEKIHVYGRVFDEFFNSCFENKIMKGKHTFMMDLDQWLQTQESKEDYQKYLKEELSQKTSGSMDSHPPLYQRIEALKKYESKTNTDDESSALNLIDNATDLERELVSQFTKKYVESYFG